MSETPQTTELKAALLRFENLVDEVPERDDVDRWIEQVREAFDLLQSLVGIRRRRIHHKLFGEIAALDPSRTAQIEQLRAVDQDIENLLDVVTSHLIVLELPRSEREETDIEQQVLDFIDRGMELVYWIKQQEEAVAEWFAEAFAQESRSE